MTRSTGHSLLSEAMDVEKVWRRNQVEQRYALLRRIRRQQQMRLLLAMGIAVLLALLFFWGFTDKFRHLLTAPCG